MLKKLCMLGLFVSSIAFAASPVNERENLQIGRYQMAGVMNQLYLLDTATGQVWRSTTDKYFSGEPDNWTLQIVNPPEGAY